MLLLFSHNGLSDTNANGITIKNLLSAYAPEEKVQFYCDTAAPDFSAASGFFRVTDVQAVKACLLKKYQHIFTQPTEKKSAQRIGGALKKRRYNYALKWLREWLWRFSPWGHCLLRRWIAEQNPDAIVYMVGESHFMDKLVLKTCKKTKKPLVLYHAEAYRLVDLRTRKFLERTYYKKAQRLYQKLNRTAKLIIYNSEPLRQDYERKYPAQAETMVAYNSAQLLDKPYQSGTRLKITYFGNFGVGRHKSLIELAQCLQEIDPALQIDLYGRADEEIEREIAKADGIRFCGFLEQSELKRVIENTDLLLHVESFDTEIAMKLRYAFSTKIAQCLAAGRCFLSFAPETMASSQYLREKNMPLACDKAQLYELLTKLIGSEELRREFARRGVEIAKNNHDLASTAEAVRKRIDEIVKKR